MLFPNRKAVSKTERRRCIIRSFSLLAVLLCFQTLAAERARLELWAIPTHASTNPWVMANRAVFERFVELHPDIEVVRTSGIRVEGERRESAFLMSMAGETAPYCFDMLSRTVLNYAAQGFLHPLDDYLSDSKKAVERVPEPLWPIVRLSGKTYGLIHRYHVMALHYRRDIFEEVGLDPDKPPENWDELFEYARRLTHPAKGRFGYYITTGVHGGWAWTNFVWQSGGHMVQQQADGTWKATFDSPEAIRALEFYKRMRWTKWQWRERQVEGVVLTGTDSCGIADFCQGKVAMTLAPAADPTYVYRFLQGGLSPEQIGIAPLPAGPDGHRGNMIVGWAYGINSQVEDNRSREAAWEYCRFIAGEEAESIYVRTLVAYGQGRTVRPDLLKKYGYDDILRQLPAQWVDRFDELIRYSKPQPYAPNYDKIQNERLPPFVLEVMENPDADCAGLLKDVAGLCNAKIFRYRGGEEQKRLRRIFGPVVVVVFAVFAFFFFRMIRLLSARAAPAAGAVAGAGRRRWRIHAMAALFMAPAIVAVLVWAYYPLLRGATMAFYDYRILGDSRFVGLDNFITALTQGDFWYSLARTVYYVGLSLLLGFVSPIILAMLLNEVPRFKLGYRVLWYLPALTSGLVVMFLWKQLIYDPTPYGFLNGLLSRIGIPPQRWLNDPDLAMVCIVVTGVWAHVGPGSIIYLAALKTIPEEVYEAADLDGAGAFRKVLHVTFPMLKVLIIINFVGAFVGAFHTMGNILVMTGGGPGDATKVIGLEIFYDAFLYLRFGYATAIAWVLGSLLIGFTMYQLKILRDVRFTTAKEAA